MTYSLWTIKNDLKEMHCFLRHPSSYYLYPPVLNGDYTIFYRISPKATAITSYLALQFNRCYIRMRTDMLGHMKLHTLMYAQIFTQSHKCS